MGLPRVEGQSLSPWGKEPRVASWGARVVGGGGWNFPDGTVGVVCSPRRSSSAFALNAPKAEKGAGPPICPCGRFLLWTVDGGGELEP